MEKSQLVVNTSVLLKIPLNHPDKVELVDGLQATPLVKAKVLVPYLSNLYQSLTLRSEKTTLGVPRYALNEVS